MSSMFPTNEHPVERVVRGIAGIGLLSLLAVGPVPGWGLAGLIGIVPLVTAVMGSCPAYTLLGISTAGKEKSE